MHDPRVEGDDRIKAIVEQSIDYLVELSMMCGSADGVREEVDNMILNFLCGAECLIEEAGKVYGPDRPTGRVARRRKPLPGRLHGPDRPTGRVARRRASLPGPLHGLGWPAGGVGRRREHLSARPFAGRCIMFTIVLVGFGVVVLALLSIYCLCCVAARDQRRAEALTAERLAAEQLAVNVQRKGREEDAYSRGYGSHAEYRASLWRDEER